MTINELKKTYKNDLDLTKFIINLLDLLNNDSTLLPKLINYYQLVIPYKTNEVDLVVFKMIVLKVIEIDSHVLDNILNDLLQNKTLVFVFRNKRRYLKLSSNINNLKITNEEINQVLTTLHSLSNDIYLKSTWKKIKNSGVTVLLKDNFGITIDGLIEAVYLNHHTNKELIKKTIWHLHYKNKLIVKQVPNERGTKTIRTYVIEKTPIKKN